MAKSGVKSLFSLDAFGSRLLQIGSPKTSNGSLKTSRKGHRKLQGKVTENFKWIFESIEINIGINIKT
jgi:hypothetical protein